MAKKSKAAPKKFAKKAPPPAKKADDEKKTAAKEEKASEKKTAAKEEKASEKKTAAKETEKSTDKAQSVEQNLLDATGEKSQAKSEAFDDYARRLAEVIDKDESDTIYKKLSATAKEWFNAVAEADDGSGKPLPPFPDQVKEPKSEKVKEPKAEKVKEKVKEPKAAGGKKKRSGGSARVAQLVAADQKADADTIVKAAKKEGLTIAESQVRNVYAQMHRLIKILSESGKTIK